MNTVWKFPVHTSDQYVMEMPTGARLLSVAVQHQEPMLWALVDTDAPKVGRRFRVAGTGHPMSDVDALLYVGSYQLLDGALVFHLFDGGEVPS